MSCCPFAHSHMSGAHLVLSLPDLPCPRRVHQGTRAAGWVSTLRMTPGAVLLGGNEPTALRLCPQVSIAFQDLAVRFSEDEWRLLGEGQRALYLDVMRENYDTLASLGEERAGPGVGWEGDDAAPRGPRVAQDLGRLVGP